MPFEGLSGPLKEPQKACFALQLTLQVSMKTWCAQAEALEDSRKHVGSNTLPAAIWRRTCELQKCGLPFGGPPPERAAALCSLPHGLASGSSLHLFNEDINTNMDIHCSCKDGHLVAARTLHYSLLCEFQ